MVTDYDLDELISILSASRFSSQKIEFEEQTFVIWQELPAKYICSHYHPKRMKDPLLNYESYQLEEI